MPVKRRLMKARKLDELETEELFYGPGTCLINGCGYLGPYGDGFWREKPEAVKTEVLDTMRADWERNCATVMAAWAARTPHDLYIAREYHGDPIEPWAMREFGQPGRNRAETVDRPPLSGPC